MGDFPKSHLPSADFWKSCACHRATYGSRACNQANSGSRDCNRQLPEAVRCLPSGDFKVAARLPSRDFRKSCLQSCDFRKSHQGFGHFCKTNISCSSASWKKLGAHSNRKPHLSNCCGLDHIIAPADPCSPSFSELHLRGSFRLATV